MIQPNDYNGDPTRELISEIRVTVREIGHLLRGNGSDGLVTVVALMRARQDLLEQRIDELLKQKQPDLETTRARWRAVAELAIASAALSALALGLWG